MKQPFLQSRLPWSEDRCFVRDLLAWVWTIFVQWGYWNNTIISQFASSSVQTSSLWPSLQRQRKKVQMLPVPESLTKQKALCHPRSDRLVRAAEASPALWQNAVAVMSCLNCESAIKEETWPGDKASHACGNTAWKISTNANPPKDPNVEWLLFHPWLVQRFSQRGCSGTRDNSLCLNAG